MIPAFWAMAIWSWCTAVARIVLAAWLIDSVIEWR